jgi:hypothetical protein
MIQNTGAIHEIALLDFFGCTEVAFTVDVVLAVGLDSAMIVDFSF